MTISIDPSSQNISDSGIVAFTQDPKLGFNVQFRRGDDNNKRYMLKFNVTMKFYDSKGNLINLTDENKALLGMSSFNSHQEPIGVVEGFVPGPGTSVIGITGSSIQNQGGRYYSVKEENTRNQFGQDNIDSTNNPYFWYLGSVLKMTGTSPTFQIFSGDPTQFGRPEPSSTYIPGLWMTVTSELATTVALKPTEPKAPVKPTEPVKPNKATNVVPKKPVEPKKPVAPEKPSINPPVSPNTPPTTPPTPPTPKAGEKPKAPTPKAGEKPKEPQAPNRPQPKDPDDPATTPPVKPEAPKVTPIPNRSFTVQKGSVTKPVEKPVEKPSKKPIEKPVKKVTTIWVTVTGKVLKPRTDGEQPKENFDGYEFVRTDKDKDGNTTHIYRPLEKPVKKVTTIWVTEKGRVLKPRTDGEQPKDNFDGYEFVRTDKDKDGNTTHIYRPIEKPVKKVTTIWATESGKVLKSRTDGEQPKENFDGYEFVRTDKDKDGNIYHLYKPIVKERPKEPSKPVGKPDVQPTTTKELPKTGYGEMVRTPEEVLMRPLDSLPQAERSPQMYGFDYVVGQFPETIELRSVVRDLAPEEDMPVNAIIFSSPSVQRSGDYVLGTVVGVQTDIGWQIIDPYASGLYRATNTKCELEPGIGEDLYDVVRNLNEVTISRSDVDQLSDAELTL